MSPIRKTMTAALNNNMLMFVNRPNVEKVYAYHPAPVTKNRKPIGTNILSGEYSVAILKMMIMNRRPSLIGRIWLLPMRFATGIGSKHIGYPERRNAMVMVVG